MTVVHHGLRRQQQARQHRSRCQGQANLRPLPAGSALGLSQECRRDVSALAIVLLDGGVIGAVDRDAKGELVSDLCVVVVMRDGLPGLDLRIDPRIDFGIRR